MQYSKSSRDGNLPDGLGLDPGGDEIFHTCPYQPPPAQWVPPSQRWRSQGITQSSHPLLAPRLCMGRTIPLTRLWDFMARYSVTFTFTVL
jgi:hypothetical protein